jgi:hypothetical protein
MNNTELPEKPVPIIVAGTLETAFILLETISKEKELNTCNRRGKTALFHAKDPKMLYLLLEYGADPTVGAFQVGLGISDKKNNSAEDGIDGTNGYFRWNSGSSAEQKIFEILF